VDRITEVTRDCFDALIQLRAADDAALPPAAVLHQRLRGFVDAMLQRAAQAGYSREDANDIAYAVVALADEIVLSRSEELRRFWADQSLQLLYFRENVAGEGFFTRLQGLRRDPRRREILQVYALALLLGFQGRFQVRGGELELLNLLDEVQRDLERGRRFDPEALSPQGERPGEAREIDGRRRLAAWIALGALGFLLLLYLGLRVSLGSSADAVVGRVESAKLN
jgi:type VI secretion system protein ImpK